jgi:hypothetical protein
MTCPRHPGGAKCHFAKVDHQLREFGMKLRIMLVIAAYLTGAGALLLPASKASAQTSKEVVGTWTMVSNVTDQSGKKVEPNPKGIMVERPLRSCGSTRWPA